MNKIVMGNKYQYGNYDSFDLLASHIAGQVDNLFADEWLLNTGIEDQLIIKTIKSGNYPQTYGIEPLDLHELIE